MASLGNQHYCIGTLSFLVWRRSRAMRSTELLLVVTFSDVPSSGLERSIVTDR